MKIHIEHPWSTEGNYGKAINESFSKIGEDDWLCILDWDVMFIHPESITQMYEYVRLLPDAGLLTCFATRIGQHAQRWNNKKSGDPDFMNHYRLADRIVKRNRNGYTRMTDSMSGFLHLVSKKTWNEIKYTEEKIYLWVDDNFCKQLYAAGKEIYRMDGIYIWHSYRLWKDSKDREHLKFNGSFGSAK